jgi:hypothetical protein
MDARQEPRDAPMDEILSRIWQEIVSRPDGPMAFRFYLQPIMASIYAIKSGRRDAKEGKPAYFWGLFTKPERRGEMLRDGWKSVRNVFIFAVVMDVIYQITVLGGIRPVEGLLVAVSLAIVPYVLVRGPVNRIARLFHDRSRSQHVRS